MCGSFAETKANRLLKACPGPPPRQLGSGGLRQQLTKLRASLHPVTGERLPQAIRTDGTQVEGTGTYARLRTSSMPDKDFLLYVPSAPAALKTRCGMEAAAKRQLMLGRIKMKQGREARQRKKARRAEVRVEAQALVESFMAGSYEASVVHSGA